MLQQVRDENKWEEWIIFILNGVEETAGESVLLITAIKKLMQKYKQEIRTNHPKMYSQDLLNNLFKYPYTKIDFIQSDLRISRSTAIRYLETLVKAGLLIKQKIGRDNFYLNQDLFSLLKGD